MSGFLFGSYIIGSVARGEHDAQSDLDVLAIVSDGRGKVDESTVLADIPPVFQNLDVGVSWYGINRISEMFKNGDLFAWHIWSEHITLTEVSGFSLSSLGPPSPYKSALEDVASFRSILSKIPAQLDGAPDNAVYEMGLIYVCLRNIAMSASGLLCVAPNFSRYSPYELTGVAPVPLPVEFYETAMQCRMAGQRGFEPPAHLSADFVVRCYDLVADWVWTIERVVRNEVY